MIRRPPREPQHLTLEAPDGEFMPTSSNPMQPPRQCSLLEGEQLPADRTVAETNRAFERVWTKLGGTLVALSAILFLGATVQYKDLRESTPVVTSVDFSTNNAELVETVMSLAGIGRSIEVPPGISFFTEDGLDQNVAIEIGKNAKAAVDPAGLPTGTVARSVSVAIGAEADATDHSNASKSQGIAVGWFAQAIANNAIAIGSGAQHPGEDIETGNATVASGQTSIAAGYDAKATAQSAMALGRSAKAKAANAVQLGTGVNEEANTLKFMGTTVVRNGKVVTDGVSAEEAYRYALAHRVPTMTFTEDDEKKVTTFSAGCEEDDTDYRHQIILYKNHTPTSTIPVGADAQIYRHSTVNAMALRILDLMVRGNVTSNDVAAFRAEFGIADADLPQE